MVEVYKAAKHFNAGEKQLGDWLETARNIADTMIEKFGDAVNGGLFMTEENIAGIRLKSAEDMNSLPSMNAVSAMMLDELAFILEDKRYSDFARKIIACFAHYVRENPMRCLSMITADLMWKPFKPKKKPEPEPKAVPTDEELNREEPEVSADNAEEKKPSRASRRSARTETPSASSGRSDRASRRSARPHRTREK